jgi:uncharacterized protein involved in exopolysaccharide biosynthesis
MKEEINLLDYWNVIWRRKTALIALVMTSVLITMVVSFQLPKYYTSEAVIITTSSESGGLGAALSVLPVAGVLAGAGGIQTSADKVMVILKSRSIAEAVIKKFNLIKAFNEKKWDAVKGTWKDPGKPPLLEDAVKELTRKIVQVKKSREGAITVSVEWKDPQLAADIANYYVSSLAGFLNEKAINLTVQVVDRAVPAERKSSPKIRLQMTMAGAVSLFIGVLIAFVLEYLSRQKKM